MTQHSTSGSRVDDNYDCWIRFVFCHYRSDPLFHADPECEHLQRNDINGQKIAQAQIRKDHVNPENFELPFCPDCAGTFAEMAKAEESA